MERERELQLLPTSSIRLTSWVPTSKDVTSESKEHIDLSLSIGVLSRAGGARSIQALKLQAAEQVRLAAAEKAYAEQVRELTRKEMEMAEKEFARARLLWERAREEIDKVERMKENAMRMVGSTCAEITCQACRQRFRP